MNRFVSNIAFLGLTILAIVACYFRSIDHVGEDYAALEKSLRIINQNNVDLDSAVLSLRLGIRQDYDQLTHFETTLRGRVSHAQSGVDSRPLFTPELNQHLQQLEHLIEQKLTLSHDFKATHAIVRNSIAALLRNVRLATQNPQMPAETKSLLADLETSGYRFCMSGNSSDRKQFAAALARLQPAPKSTDIDWAIRHGSKLIELRQLLDEIVSQLVDTPIRPATLAVIDNASQTYLQQNRMRSRYNAGLIAVSMLLLGYCATQATTLWKNARELNVINKELEQRRDDQTADLQTQKQTLKAVLESVAAGIVSVNEQGDIVSFNPAAEEIFGEHWLKSKSMLEQLEAVEIVDPTTYESIPLIKLPMVRALQGEHVRNEELLVRRKDKDVLVSINAIPLTSDGKQGAVITVLDITQQWKRDLNQRMLREGLDFAQDAMFVCESTGQIIDVNNVSCKRLDYSRDELLKVAVSDFDPGLPAAQWPEFWSQLKGQKAMVLESQHRKKDGTTFPVEVTINYSAFGGIEYACCFVRDITQRKQAERERDQLAGELQNAARQAGMAEVATGVLHNVGNVLNSVNVSTNLIRDRINSSPVDHLVKAASIVAENESDLSNFLNNDKRGKHFPTLLKQLATSFRNEQNAQRDEIQALTKSIEHIKEIVSMQQSFAKKSGTTESVDPIELIEDAIKINDASLVRHGVELVRDFTKVPNIEVRRHEVLQILINLIKNAKQAVDRCNNKEKIIRLTACVEGEHVRLEVHDNGIGISAENLKNIFQHGFTTKTTGHGFGLHSCANSARDMGGSMSVHSDGEGTGATFTLKLPLQILAPSRSTQEIPEAAFAQLQPIE